MGKRPRYKKKTKKTKKGGTRRSGPPLAARASRHALYERAVQEPEADVEFAIDTFRERYGVRPQRMREDFCGTAALCRDWVRAHRGNHAWGVDIDAEVLAWGRAHNVDPLPPAQRKRVTLIAGDVMSVSHEPVDVVMAQNFSYFIFEQRTRLIEYLRRTRAQMSDPGMLVLDAYGGPESTRRALEETDFGDFTYVWDQDDFDPINRRATCYIHFKFPDGSKQRRAFTYVWRLYTLPELREALLEAGFAAAAVYWEGTDPETEEGDGVYTEQESAEPDEAWVCYVVGFTR